MSCTLVGLDELCKMERAPNEPVEERAAEGVLAGNGRAARWLLRNATLEEVLTVQTRQQLRFVPGGQQPVAIATPIPTPWERPNLPLVPPRLPSERTLPCRRARLGLRTPTLTALASHDGGVDAGPRVAERVPEEDWGLPELAPASCSCRSARHRLHSFVLSLAEEGTTVANG